MSAEITYGGNVIASLEEGQTATLNCAGKKAVTDIAIDFADAGYITYNGTTTEVDDGGTATLSCAGKKMLTDVVVEVVIVGGAYTITTVIDDAVDIAQNTAPATIIEGQTATFRLAASSVTGLDPYVVVSGAEWSYVDNEPEEGFIGYIDLTITLSNPTDDVVVSVTAVKPPPISTELSNTEG